jgi:CRP-like cAMP-binding protein
MGGESPWKQAKGGILLGEARFMDEIKDFVTERGKTAEIPRRQRYVFRPPLSELFVQGRPDPEAVFGAYRNYHYTQKEIGDHLGIHYATVSRIIKRLKQSSDLGCDGSAKNKT